ncbi:putative ribonuclease H-like domain-containing protein [Tanacetum coccineum]
MDLETAQTNNTAKLPILKQGEYEIWKLKIDQYNQVQDYALWDVIENENSFKLVAQTTTNAEGTSTTLIPGPETTEEKVQKKNDVKARIMLLMALSNEHLLTFNQYKDAKTLFAAIQIRFSGNNATKKTQKTLLKQMYENFSALSTESLDSIFNMLQKIRSKPDLDTMSFDDLYNNFKIIEQEVKGTANSSSSLSSQNMAFVSSPSSTNKVNTAYEVSIDNTQVSPASTQVRTASTQVSTANLSDATIYAFLANQPNGSHLVHEDLEQIHEDDLEEMDLKESPDALLVEELVSNDKLEKKIVFPTVAKIEFVIPKQQEKPVRKPVKYAEMYRPNSAVVNAVMANQVNDVKASAWNMSYLSDFKKFDGGYVTFGGGAKGGKIIGKRTLKIGKLDFEDVYFVKELQFNLFSVSQMCDKKNSVLFTDTGCFVLSPDFKLPDESQDETSGILKNFITKIENLVDKKVKIIRCDNGTKFKNRVMSEFCKKKGIKKEFSVARTPQQNDAAEEEKIDEVLVVKPHNKTPYELFRGRTHALSFKRPFGCHVTILNTLDHIRQSFDGKSDEGFFVRYSLNSTNSNDFVGTKESIGAGQSSKEIGSSQDYILMPLWKDGLLFDSYSKNASNNESQPSSDARKKDVEGVSKESGIDDHERPKNSAQDVNTVGPSINTASSTAYTDHAILKSTHANFFGDEVEVDMSNITTTYPVPSTPNTRIHKDHSLDHVIGDVQSRRAQKGNPGIKRSKLDKSSARRASAIQVTIVMSMSLRNLRMLQEVPDEVQWELTFFVRTQVTIFAHGSLMFNRGWFIKRMEFSSLSRQAVDANFEELVFN